MWSIVASLRAREVVGAVASLISSVVMGGDRNWCCGSPVMDLSPVVSHWVGDCWESIMIRESRIGIMVLLDVVVHSNVLCWWIVVSRSWCNGSLIMDSCGVFVPSVVVVIIMMKVLSAVVIASGLRSESAVSNNRSLVSRVIVIGFVIGVSGHRSNINLVMGGSLLSGGLGLLLLILRGGRLCGLLVHSLLLHALVVDWLDVVHNWCWVVNRVDHGVVNWVHDGGMVD